MPIQNFESTWMTDEHKMLLESATRFFKEQWGPKDEAWRAQGMMDRQAWRDAGANGFLCASMPEEYGGAGGDFGHEAALILAQAAAGQSGFGGSLHSGIVAPYILHYGTEEQKMRWLPKMATGELISAIAMTEPGTGSDLQGVRTSAVLDGDTYKINGSKTFITNGQLANLIIVVCKTDKDKGAQGISLFVVETDQVDGFRRGRHLDAEHGRHRRRARRLRPDHRQRRRHRRDGGTAAGSARGDRPAGCGGQHDQGGDQGLCDWLGGSRRARAVCSL